MTALFTGNAGYTTLIRSCGLVAAVVTVVLAAMAPAPAHAGTPTTTHTQRVIAAKVATSKAGSPYRWGATGPSRFDCSGLILYSFKRAGKTLSARTSYSMWNLGRRRTRSQLRRGDLVWTWDRSLGHVGIYLGKGKYVHAPGAGRKVSVSPLPTGRGFIGAVRP